MGLQIRRYSKRFPALLTIVATDANATLAQLCTSLEQLESRLAFRPISASRIPSRLELSVLIPEDSSVRVLLLAIARRVKQLRALVDEPLKGSPVYYRFLSTTPAELSRLDSFISSSHYSAWELDAALLEMAFSELQYAAQLAQSSSTEENQKSLIAITGELLSWPCVRTAIVESCRDLPDRPQAFSKQEITALQHFKALPVNR